MADSKTTTVVADGVAHIEVHDPADVSDVAQKLLDAADSPHEVETETYTGGIGFKVSEKLAKKAKLVQTARSSSSKTKTDAEKKAEAEAAEKAAAEQKAAEEKAAAEKAAAESKTSTDAGDSGQS